MLCGPRYLSETLVMHIRFFLPIGHTTLVFALPAADTLYIQLALCVRKAQYTITSTQQVLLPVSLTYVQPKSLL